MEMSDRAMARRTDGDIDRVDATESRRDGWEWLIWRIRSVSGRLGASRKVEWMSISICGGTEVDGCTRIVVA